MEIIRKEPKELLKNLYKKQNISTETLSNFKKNLTDFLEKTKDANREGKQETDLRDFLNDAFYKDRFYINKKETIDWAIHNGKDAKTSVGVIIEVKSTSAKTEMMTETEPNAKALHELVLYYLRERIDHNNHEIRHLIATNCHEWYVFDELWFNENIFTTKFKKTYQDWKNSGHGTDDFYKFHAKTHLENLEKPIEFCKIDLREYAKTDDKKLTELYKILSPEHLLKQEIANDANKLNKPFYNELLYIIGIEERKADDSNKKIIDRLPTDKRQDGTLLENAINELRVNDCLSKIHNIEAFGETETEQLYSIGLELCITWLNRILFLKLLEAQLVKYHGGDKNQKFLNYDKIRDFDELKELFFEVLAIQPNERSKSVREKYGDIPYLNSSLFEPTELEKTTFKISELKDRLEISYFSDTVVVNDSGKTIKGQVNTLKYLFSFLNSFDFGSSENNEKASTSGLINASVLGLIFEKLNGYKDGSFYTPAFITMYMCRETIRRAVVQKLNENHDWNCTDFDDLKDIIGNFPSKENRKKFNESINSIRICDPAVGSGHFLVSALNEMISIKADLKILQHPDGRTLNGLQISIENDELVVFDENEGKEFEYRIGKNGNLISEKQLIQETLFEEKRTIIENCLFGVDINPKSVSICQLRLWIELLKNAYYKNTHGMTQSHAMSSELETLPNIDINIKTGNSLVAKYALDEDLSEVFRKQKFGIETYRTAVAAYKEAPNKAAKAELQRFINEIKEQFRETVKNTDPRRKKLKELLGKRVLLDNNIDLFGNKTLSDDQLELQKRKLNQQLTDLESEITDVENNKIFRNAFEWRFEFPEVLNEKGDFVGFDVVVGNPPYVKVQSLQTQIREGYQAQNYISYNKSTDLYCLFFEKSVQILKKSGYLNFITPNKFVRSNYGSNTRLFLSNQTILSLTDFGELPVFENAATFPMISLFQKKENSEDFIFTEVQTLEFNSLEEYILYNSKSINHKNIDGENWSISTNKSNETIKNKIKIGSITLENYTNGEILFGIKTGFNEAYIIDESKYHELIEKDKNSFEIIKPLLNGDDCRKYKIENRKRFIILAKMGIEIKKYPAIEEHLLKYKNQLEKRSDKGKYWYDLRACNYYDVFDKPKILYPDIALESRFTIDYEKFYPNATLFCIPFEDKYLLSILNSKLIWSYLSEVCPVLGDINKRGRLRLKTIYLKELPIKICSPESQLPFIERVDKILSIKKEDPTADTTQLESEIDEMVYDLYELTEDERQIVGRV